MNDFENVESLKIKQAEKDFERKHGHAPTADGFEAKLKAHGYENDRHHQGMAKACRASGDLLEAIHAWQNAVRDCDREPWDKIVCIAQINKMLANWANIILDCKLDVPKLNIPEDADPEVKATLRKAGLID